VGRMTRTKSGSWLRRSDSNVIQTILGADSTFPIVTKVMEPWLASGSSSHEGCLSSSAAFFAAKDLGTLSEHNNA